MQTGKMAFTAVFLRNDNGYVGFIEELPGVTAHGRTLEEARDTLKRIAVVVFDEERRGAAELLEGKEVVRESFLLKVG